MTEHNDTNDDEQADDQPDSAVFLDGETANQLLSEGETTATLIEETRVCRECPAQFTNAYDLFDQRIDEVPA